MIVAQVRRSIEQRRLIARGDHVLAACSGGADSVAMTHALARLGPDLGFTLVVASIDHGLRADAHRDVAVARDLAQGLGLPFRERAIEVPGGPSLQAEARAGRYAALLDLARAESAGPVAVGHTCDDQAETVLARILRGSGVAGLGAIEPRRADGVVRPLIDCRRAEVLDHLAHHGLPSVQDPSNGDPRFLRTRVRQVVLPGLVAEDPQVVLHLAHLADDARDLGAHVDALAADALGRAIQAPNRLEVAPLVGLGRAVRAAALRRWVGDLTGRLPSRPVLASLLELLDGRQGAVRMGGGQVVTRRGDRLLAGPDEAPNHHNHTV